MDNKDFIIYNLEKKFKKINLYKDYKNAWKLKYIFYKDDLKSFS